MKLTPQVLRRPVQRLGEGDIILACRSAPATRAMGVTEMRLLTMGMPNSRSMCLAGGHQMLGAGGRSCRRSSGRQALASAVGAVEQGDAHGDGADVQMLLVDHVDGAERSRL